jgi:chitosanase
MNLTEQQKRIIIQVVNVFETGTVTGKYGAVVVYPDGPGKIRQVTFGRSQTTEYGNLKELIQMYIDKGGARAAELRPYLPKFGVTPLADDMEFRQLLQDAGKNDPIMKNVQDEFFDLRYFQPAMKWMDINGMVLPLSALVIYDSHVHSGSILPFLRQKFPATVPAKGGDERAWIQQYVNARHEWLANSSDTLLQKTVYRMKCFENEMARNNWDLSMLPVIANGIPVNG